MQVNKDEVAAVFVDLGYTWAAGWDAAGLTKKLNGKGGIAPCRKKGHQFTDPKAEALFKAIDDAQEAGTLVRVVDAPVPKPEKAFRGKARSARGKRILKAAEAAVKSPVKVETKSTPAPQQKPAKAKPGRPTTDQAEKAQAERVDKPEYYRPDGVPRYDAPRWLRRKYYATNPRKPSGRGTIMMSVIDELKRAGKAKTPVTKQGLLAVLVGKFPTRDAKKMTTNLNNLIPTRLRWIYGIHVWTGRVEGGRGYYIVGDGRKPQKEGLEK